MTTARDQSLEPYPDLEGWRDPLDGLVYAFVLDGAGGARELDWDGLLQWSPRAGPLWVHLDYEAERAVRWLREDSGLEAGATDALLETHVRPQLDLIGDEAALIGLRGVNLNPGANPEDMVSLRIWTDAARVITLRHQRIAAVRDTREALVAGRGPRTIADLVTTLAFRLVARMGPVLGALDDQVDELEEDVAAGQLTAIRTRLAEARRQAISLRRHLAPEREVLSELGGEDTLAWLESGHRRAFRGLRDRVTRYIEDLDEARERASVTHEEVGQRLAEQLNRRMLVLALVAAVFLPLSLLTGLLGINVGGIPGADWGGAFWLVGGLLVGLAVAELFWLRRSGWF